MKATPVRFAADLPAKPAIDRSRLEVAAALGDPLALERLGRGAGQPGSISQWVATASRAANEQDRLLVQVRIAIAAAWLAWTPRYVEACLAIEAAEAWVLCPCPDHLEAARGARSILRKRFPNSILVLTHQDAANLAAYYAAWAVEQSPADAAHAAETAAAMPQAFFHTDAEVRAEIRNAVVPWIMGEGDPVAHRVRVGGHGRLGPAPSLDWGPRGQGMGYPRTKADEDSR